MTAQKMDALDIEIYQLMKELGIPVFAAALASTNSMKSFYHTINEYAIHSAPGKR